MIYFSKLKFFIKLSVNVLSQKDYIEEGERRERKEVTPIDKCEMRQNWYEYIWQHTPQNKCHSLIRKQKIELVISYLHNTYSLFLKRCSYTCVSCFTAFFGVETSACQVPAVASSNQIQCVPDWICFIE